MKRLSIALLALGAIGTGLATLADQSIAEPVGNLQGAGSLQTQPLSVNQSTVILVSSPSGNTPYKRETLNSISASIQSRPPSTKGGLAIPAFIPRGLETGPAPATAVNPLEFFKIQSPERGVRFRLSDSP